MTLPDKRDFGDSDYEFIEEKVTLGYLGELSGIIRVLKRVLPVQRRRWVVAMKCCKMDGVRTHRMQVDSRCWKIQGNGISLGASRRKQPDQNPVVSSHTFVYSSE